jgi:hypothetical protein
MNWKILVKWTGLAIAFVVAGCDVAGTVFPENGDEPLTSDKRFLIDSLRLEGTTRSDCSVQVQDQPDGDQSADLSWWVQFNLDDGQGPQSLSRDTGGQQTHVLNVTAQPVDGGDPVYKRVTITLYE